MVDQGPAQRRPARSVRPRTSSPVVEHAERLVGQVGKPLDARRERFAGLGHGSSGSGGVDRARAAPGVVAGAPRRSVRSSPSRPVPAPVSRRPSRATVPCGRPVVRKPDVRTPGGRRQRGYPRSCGAPSTFVDKSGRPGGRRWTPVGRVGPPPRAVAARAQSGPDPSIGAGGEPSIERSRGPVGGPADPPAVGRSRSSGGPSGRRGARCADRPQDGSLLERGPPRRRSPARGRPRSWPGRARSVRAGRGRSSSRSPGPRPRPRSPPMARARSRAMASPSPVPVIVGVPAHPVEALEDPVPVGRLDPRPVVTDATTATVPSNRPATSTVPAFGAELQGVGRAGW